MPSATDSTQWPAIPIPSEVKELISRLFSLVESKDNRVGEQLANDVFTPEGKFLTPHSNAMGRAEILICRDNVWGTVDSRKHNITKIYASDRDGMDVLLMGDIESRLTDGSEKTVGFIARLVFERTEGEGSGVSPGKVKIKLYQAAAFTAGSH